MRGEFCIAQIIRWNAKLREYICSWLGINPDVENPLSLLPEIYGEYAISSLAEQLNCDYQDVFLVLRKRLGQSIGVIERRIFPSLDSGNISLFFNEIFLDQIANALQCSNRLHDILPRLFDESRLERLVYQAEIISEGEKIPIDKLFFRMVSPKELDKLFDFLGGLNDIWGVLFGLLKEDARNQLCKYFDCEPEEIFAAALGRANLGESSKEMEELIEDESQRLDTLGVAKLQETLRVFANTYLRQAREIAGNLWKTGADNSNARMLLPLLNFFGSQAYRQALHEAIYSRQSIGSLGFKVEVLSPQSYRGDIHLQAIINEESNYLTIQFNHPADSEWKDILRLRGLNIEYMKHVVQRLPSTAAELQGIGETLVQHVLTTEIEAYPTLERTVWNLLTEEDNSLIQAFVLSKRKLPDDLQVGEVFKSKKGVGPIASADAQTICSTPQEIFERVKKDYERYGISPNLK